MFQIELPIGPLPPCPKTLPTLTKAGQRKPNTQAKRRGKPNDNSKSHR
jgi:hypothetical protein